MAILAGALMIFPIVGFALSVVILAVMAWLGVVSLAAWRREKRAGQAVTRVEEAAA